MDIRIIKMEIILVWRRAKNLIFFTNILYADKNLQSLEEIVNQELCKPCDLLTANKLTFEYKEKFCHILSR